MPFTGGAAIRPSVFDIDLYVDPVVSGNNYTLNTAAVNRIRTSTDGQRTKWAICYLSAGTFEPWRPDASLFPTYLKGKSVSGFGEEKWLDIRQLTILLPIMEARAQKCRDSGVRRHRMGQCRRLYEQDRVLAEGIRIS